MQRAPAPHPNPPPSQCLSSKEWLKAISSTNARRNLKDSSYERCLLLTALSLYLGGITVRFLRNSQKHAPHAIFLLQSFCCRHDLQPPPMNTHPPRTPHRASILLLYRCHPQFRDESNTKLRLPVRSPSLCPAPLVSPPMRTASQAQLHSSRPRRRYSSFVKYTCRVTPCKTGQLPGGKRSREASRGVDHERRAGDLQVQASKLARPSLLSSRR